jgi:hypothetical protein
VPESPHVYQTTPTYTTQGIASQSEVERLRFIVKTKDQIIASLRRQLAQAEEFNREMLRLLA